MTFLEAVKAIEKKVETYHIRWPDGSPMYPVEAMGRIGKYHGARYDKCIDDLYEGRISIEQYFVEMIKMITEFSMRERKFL